MAHVTQAFSLASLGGLQARELAKGGPSAKGFPVDPPWATVGGPQAAPREHLARLWPVPGVSNVLPGLWSGVSNATLTGKHHWVVKSDRMDD
jgi:hypothetical protein